MPGGSRREPPGIEKALEMSCWRTRLERRCAQQVLIEMQCEMERLMNDYPDRASTLIEQAKGLAIDPERDRKALMRIDNALAGRVFASCEWKRKRKP